MTRLVSPIRRKSSTARRHFFLGTVCRREIEKPLVSRQNKITRHAAPDGPYYHTRAPPTLPCPVTDVYPSSMGGTLDHKHHAVHKFTHALHLRHTQDSLSRGALCQKAVGHTAKHTRRRLRNVTRRRLRYVTFRAHRGTITVEVHTRFERAVGAGRAPPNRHFARHLRLPNNIQLQEATTTN